MTTTVTAKIQVRKGTAAAWTSTNPTLLSGEFGYETDTDKLKIGDGTTAWTALAYYYDPADSGGGATDHGALTGLSDDDHSQYHTDARGDARYAATGHNHSGTYEPADATLLKQADVDDTPVNGVTTAPVSSNWAYDHAALTTAHGISTFGASLVDDADAGTARTTLGLGTAATTASTDYATAAHNHSGVYLAVGADAADLGSGAATDNYVLTADGAGGAAWEAAAGGDLVDDTTPQLGGDLDLNGNQITGSGGTVTTSQPILDVSQTWNDAAVTFTALKAGVTDTASADASNLLDFQVGSSSKFSIKKNGQVTLVDGGVANADVSLVFGAAPALGMYKAASNTLGLVVAGVVYYRFYSSSGFQLASGSYVGWGTTNLNNAPTIDLTIYRDAANTLAQRNTTNAQAYRLYNTYTDASNYERLTFKWTSNLAEISTEAAGTGTLRDLSIGSTGGKLAFLGATPVVRQAHVADADTAHALNATFSDTEVEAALNALGTKLNSVLAALRAFGLLATS